MSKVTHEYHLVDPSPMPILGSIALLILAVGGIMFMHDKPHGQEVLGLGFMSVLAVLFFWWHDVIKEGLKDEAHTSIVRRGLQWGMLLFIISEVMFFFAFFFSFFKASLLPVDLFDGGLWPIGEGVWPPKGIVTFDPWGIPALNTLILLTSSLTASHAHHAMLRNDMATVIQRLTITVILGMIFTALQAYEYHHAAFGFTDGIYASNFYLATGFHGFHVIVGTLFLAVCLLRAIKGHLSPKHHLGLEFACWYWHFVDAVWIFLFIWVYWWGG